MQAKPESKLLMSRARWRAMVLGFVAALCVTNTARADEGGVSFWVPGLYGSLAAVPQQPGWAFAVINYYDAVRGDPRVAASREVTINRFNRTFSATVNVNVNANLKARPDLFFAIPSYTFATPVFGGQLTLSMLTVGGRSITSVSGTAIASVGPFTISRPGAIEDARDGFGDLYPTATLRWNHGVDSWMTYITGDIPVGMYNSASLANIGIGHGAIDAGGGYTYFNPQTGHEFSVVTGFTYNFTNTATDYRNGIDWHTDWGASQFLTKQVQVGLVGYFYNQLTADQGCLPQLCPFKSQVMGVGPQFGYIFPVAGMQGYLNLKAYGEFDGHDRPSGWNTWLTLSFSPAPPPAADKSPPPMLTKAPPRG